MTYGIEPVSAQAAHEALIYKNGILDYDAHDNYLRAFGFEYLALPCACGGDDCDGHLPSCGWGRKIETYGIECPKDLSTLRLHFDLISDLAISFMSLDSLGGEAVYPFWRYDSYIDNRGLDTFSLTCGACEEPTRGEIYDSAYIPESVFCSADCRDAAEFAAESVR